MSVLGSRNDRIATHLKNLATCLRGELPIGMDWVEVIRLANDHLLGPRLYRSLTGFAHTGLADAEAMTYLASLDAANRERNARLLIQLAELSEALAAGAIAPILLKGGAELVRCQPQGGSPRMLRDLDIMIRSEQAARTDAILRSLGYDTFPDDPGAHSAGTYFRPRDVGSVDVHLRLPVLFAHLIPPDDLETRIHAVPFGSGALRVPDASLQFVINLGHEMLHDEAVVHGFTRLGYLLELTDLAEDGSDALDWTWIMSKCRSRKFCLGLELQARLARHLGLNEFPAVGQTRLGGVLHRRRLIKLAHPWLGEVEWRAVRWAKDLRHLKVSGSRETIHGSA